MQQLRRLSWLAALLLVASPAIGGQLLPLLHPCPAEAGGHGHVAGDAHAAGSHGLPSDSGEQGDEGCTCIGSCQLPAVVTAPSVAPTIAKVEVGSPPAPIAAPPTTPRVDRPLDLLPPTTAPPLA